MTTLHTFQCSLPRPVTLLRVAGKDAGKFLHNFCTNHIERLRNGEGCEAFACDAKGRILFHWTLTFLDQAYWIATAADVQDRLFAHLDRYHFREELTLEDLSPNWSELLLLGDPFDSLPQLTSLQASAPAPMYAATSTQLQGETIYLQRLPIFGVDVVHLYGPRKVIGELSASIPDSIVRVTDEELEFRRIVMGWPKQKTDFDDKTIPQELGRNDVAISFNKGCYIGQETVARLDALGQVQRKLVGFRFENALSELPWVIKQDDKEIATITSAAVLLGANQGIGLGFARRSHFEAGTRLGPSEHPVTVTSLPIPMND